MTIKINDEENTKREMISEAYDFCEKCGIVWSVEEFKKDRGCLCPFNKGEKKYHPALLEWLGLRKEKIEKQIKELRDKLVLESL